MWIETDTYIGPCRRGGSGKFRLLNRRRSAGGDRDPSIQALLRQLRANAMDLSDAQKRDRFRLRLVATIALARRNQLNACALQLVKLEQAMTEAALAKPGAATVIEHHLAAAAALAPSR